MNKEELADSQLPLGITDIQHRKGGNFGDEWNVTVCPWYSETGLEEIPSGSGVVTLQCNDFRDGLMRSLAETLTESPDSLIGPVALGKIKTKKGKAPFAFLDYDEELGMPVYMDPDPEQEIKVASPPQPSASEPKRRGRPPKNGGPIIRSAEVPGNAPQASNPALPPDEQARIDSGQSDGRAKETIVVGRVQGYAICESCLSAGVTGADPDESEGTPGMVSGRAFPRPGGDGYSVIHQCPQGGATTSLLAVRIEQ